MLPVESKLMMVFFLLSFSQGLCMVLEASCKDGGGIIFNLVDNLLGGLHSMVSFNLQYISIIAVNNAVY